MIAELVLAGVEGGSWDAVEERMTLGRYRAFRRAWALNPPAHVLLAASLGIKPKSPGPAGGFDDLMHYLGASS